jgi:hypothetical protein
MNDAATFTGRATSVQKQITGVSILWVTRDAGDFECARPPPTAARRSRSCTSPDPHGARPSSSRWFERRVRVPTRRRGVVGTSIEEVLSP